MATETSADAGHAPRTEQSEPSPPESSPTDVSAHGGRRPNRLIHETSPYLLQHAYNPVDWYPWGPEALERAKREDKPILLSIGYSACHWCHVMERESFEDEETARQMNALYVPIKVDREERPDLDAIYMEAVQALTQHGGWPMTVFLLPDGTPFYGGTYFPATPRYGMPSFRQLLNSVAGAYRNQREDVQRGADQLRGILQQAPQLQLQGQAGPSPAIFEQAARAFAASFDATEGGFGRAPKFPQPMNLDALLRIWRRSGDDRTLHMVRLTLDKMAQGGMYDQLGGGFHRYSVDERWLVPHFEKMLYDNAQLAGVYLHAFLATGDAFYERVCSETLDYVLREMTSPEGGFYSTQDADSEGEEGRFFLWTPAEVTSLLGEADARLFCAYFDVTAAGNFEGRNILHTPRPLHDVAQELGVPATRLQEALDRGRPVLFGAREQRVKPGRDEKVLTAWNGMMLRTFAEAAVALRREDYRAAAIANAEFVLARLRAPAMGSTTESTPTDSALSNWRLLRSYKDGQAKFNAYLEDYACYTDGLLALYEATFDVRWYTAAQALAETMVAQFADATGGGFFDTSADHERLLTRPKDLYDNATPSGNAVAADALLRLDAYSGGSSSAPAESLLQGLSGAMAQHPTAFGRLLGALDFALGPTKEIAIVGEPDDPQTQALLDVVFRRYLPNRVVALARPGAAGAATVARIPLLADRPQQNGRATAYVCEHFTCQPPVTEPEALERQLAGAG